MQSAGISTICVSYELYLEDTGSDWGRGENQRPLEIHVADRAGSQQALRSTGGQSGEQMKLRTLKPKRGKRASTPAWLVSDEVSLRAGAGRRRRSQGERDPSLEDSAPHLMRICSHRPPKAGLQRLVCP